MLGKRELRHPKGFTYHIVDLNLRTIKVHANTTVGEYVSDTHVRGLKLYQQNLLMCLVPPEEITKFQLLSLSWFSSNWKNLSLFNAIKSSFEKFYKQFTSREKPRDNRMPKQTDSTESQPNKQPEKKLNLIEEFFTKDRTINAKIDWTKEPAEIAECIKKALVELTTLRIITEGDDGKLIETNINITGDIHSKNPYLTDDKLVAYHERMATVSVGIMKTYAQIFVQIASVIVPWAGIKFPEDAAKNISELIKGINLAPETADQKTS